MGTHRARITWTDAQVALGLPKGSHLTQPAWLPEAEPLGDEFWSLVCEFGPAPAVQGNPTVARVRFLMPSAPHDRLRAGTTLRLFEAPSRYAKVEILGAVEYEIDGRRFWTVRGFFEHFSRRVIPDASWGRNLDAFNDVLRGGFGTPEGGFGLRWKNHQASRRRLGQAQFDVLVEIIRRHGAGGDEADDGVVLILE